MLNKIKDNNFYWKGFIIFALIISFMSILTLRYENLRRERIEQALFDQYKKIMDPEFSAFSSAIEDSFYYPQNRNNIKKFYKLQDFELFSADRQAEKIKIPSSYVMMSFYVLLGGWLLGLIEAIRFMIATIINKIKKKPVHFIDVSVEAVIAGLLIIILMIFLKPYNNNVPDDLNRIRDRNEIYGKMIDLSNTFYDLYYIKLKPHETEFEQARKLERLKYKSTGHIQALIKYKNKDLAEKPIEICKDIISYADKEKKLLRVDKGWEIMAAEQNIMLENILSKYGAYIVSVISEGAFDESRALFFDKKAIEDYKMAEKWSSDKKRNMYLEFGRLAYVFYDDYLPKYSKKYIDQYKDAINKNLKY